MHCHKHSFLPFLLFIQFIYGYIPAFSCAIISLFFVVKTVKSRSTKTFVAYSILAAIFIFAAIWLKTNSIVILIGEVATLAVIALAKKTPPLLLPIIICCFAYAIASTIPVNLLEEEIDLDLHNSVPQTGWIAMGLQDNSAMGTGWYNGYINEVYDEHSDSQEEMKATINGAIAERVRLFTSSPKDALYFFADKLLSEWSDPTYQSLWLEQVSYEANKGYTITNPIERSLAEGKLRALYTLYVDIFQSLVFIFALLGAVFGFKKYKPLQLIFLLIFFGGFVLHFFWEAKSYYVMTYFILLFPYASFGLISLLDMQRSKIASRVKPNRQPLHAR